MDRFVLGRMQNPVRGFLHGSAAVVSVVGMVALLTRSDRAGTTLAIAVYGLALIVMYSTSAMYHSIPWQASWKRRFQQLDHTFIYALVAATFSALAVSVGQGPWLVVGLVGIWSLVALGLVKELIQGPGRRLVFPLQIVVVAVTLPALWLTLVRMDTPAATLTVVGGACYLLGAFLFVNDRPRLAPRVFSHHEFFHVVVIVSSLLHYLAVWRVVPMV
jgi:hemolysin III